MGRILGLDYGSKRVGIAETDDLKIIASPLTTVHSKDVIKYINEYYYVIFNFIVYIVIVL